MSGFIAFSALTLIAIASGFPVWLAVGVYGTCWVIYQVREVRKAR